MDQPQPPQQTPTYRYYKKTSTFVPKDDGFVTSAGNKDLAAKYGNNIGANTFTTKDIIISTLDIKKK
jgi:hypothetical protein